LTHVVVTVSGDAPTEVITLGRVSVYSHVPTASFVCVDVDTLLVSAGTNDGGEIDAPGGNGAESSGGFGQLATLACGPVGTSIGWGIIVGVDAESELAADAAEAELADAIEAVPENAVTANTRTLSPPTIVPSRTQAALVNFVRRHSPAGICWIRRSLICISLVR